MVSRSFIHFSVPCEFEGRCVLLFYTTNAISNLTLSCICLQGREFKHIIHAFMYHMTYCALFPQRQQQLHDGDGNWAAENLDPTP